MAIPSPRSNLQGVYDTNRNKFVIFGGFTIGPVNDTWEYDVATGQWTQIITASAPSARYDYGMIYDSANSRTLLFGGITGAGYIGDTWSYDGINWTQLFPALSPSARSGPLFAFDPIRAKAVLYGG